MVLLFFILFISFLLVSRKLYQAWLNPISIFVCLFLFAFFVLFSVDYLSLDLLDAELWVLYVISILAYLSGAAISYKKYNIKQRQVIFRETDNEKDYSRDIRYLFYIVFLFTMLHWASSIARYGLIGLFSSLLVTKSEDLETNKLFIQISMISMFLSPYTLYYILKYNKWISIYTVILLFTFIANLSYSRATLFWIFFLDLFVIIYYNQRRQKKIGFKLPLIIGMAILLFGNYFSSSQDMLGKVFAIEGSFLGVPMGANITTMVTYFICPLLTPYHYLRMHVDVPDFGFTLRLLYDHLSPLGIYIDSMKYMPVDFVPVPYMLNTTAIQYYIYAEGGWIWVILFFFALGYVFDRAFWTYLRKQNRFSLMWLCFLSLFLVMSIRSYLMTFLNVLVFLLVLFTLKNLYRIRKSFR